MGGMQDRLLSYKARQRTTTIVVHDSHTLPDQMNVGAWLKVNARKLGLLDIGYHFICWPDGKFLETRPHNTQGTHTSGFNRDSIGVCLIGGRRAIQGPDGEEILVPADTFTSEQKDWLRWLSHEYLMPVYGSLSLKGHSELGHHHKNLCPATNMEALRQWVNAQS